MEIVADDALVLTLLPHGEHGAVVRFLGATRGLLSGHVAGARSKARRAALQPGNRVALRLKARVSGQLPSAEIEIARSRALLAFAPETAAGVFWVTALVAAALPEGVPHPELAHRLDTLFERMGSGPGWEAELVRLEVALLAEMGVGLDLSSCALGGPADRLAFVSPNSGRAVSSEKAAGKGWAPRLLALPAFLRIDAAAPPADLAAGLALTAHFLARDLGPAWTRIAPLRDRMETLLTART
ncbi:MAG: DNA repair protein RecO [Thermaurantiacus sp.]